MKKWFVICLLVAALFTGCCSCDTCNCDCKCKDGCCELHQDN